MRSVSHFQLCAPVHYGAIVMRFMLESRSRDFSKSKEIAKLINSEPCHADEVAQQSPIKLGVQWYGQDQSESWLFQDYMTSFLSGKRPTSLGECCDGLLTRNQRDFGPQPAP